ncbi:hypothetical protein [Sporosarcina trichiuri]|uniref:hypothetical protein n=1 Tax=Sporosarcina trichiuri TaxID=3056445 RepID=UPI0025B326B9|nr:hypothetical protein [Sporosarcina sp. 0.2-SM1T-5]WJY28177.1 hypothetical protein QWT68_04120 [Sporosarcina sp. 0.2-SM1T-5]
MNFKKKYSKLTIMLALGQGVLLGIIAVAVVGFILMKTDAPDAAATPEPNVPANGPAAADPKLEAKAGEVPALGAPVAMYARQHGVFSSKGSAAAFIADSQVPAAAVVRSDSQYFVWSALGPTEQDADPAGSEGAFRKSLSVTPLACTGGGGELVQAVLKAGKVSEIQDLVNVRKQSAEGGKKDPLAEKLAAITAFTGDLNIIRMHVIAHFAESGDCVKLQF